MSLQAKRLLTVTNAVHTFMWYLAYYHNMPAKHFVYYVLNSITESKHEFEL